MGGRTTLSPTRGNRGRVTESRRTAVVGFIACPQNGFSFVTHLGKDTARERCSQLLEFERGFLKRANSVRQMPRFFDSSMRPMTTAEFLKVTLADGRRRKGRCPQMTGVEEPCASRTQAMAFLFMRKVLRVRGELQPLAVGTGENLYDRAEPEALANAGAGSASLPKASTRRSPWIQRDRYTTRSVATRGIDK
jgi:hypothetical protein